MELLARLKIKKKGARSGAAKKDTHRPHLTAENARLLKQKHRGSLFFYYLFRPSRAIEF